MSSASNADRRYRDGEWLREKYVEDGMSTYDIAEECGVVAITVHTWLREHDIETRSRGVRPGSIRVPDEDLLADIRRLVEEREDGFVSDTDYLENGEHALKTMYNRFGTWTRAKELALGDD